MNMDFLLTAVSFMFPGLPILLMIRQKFTKTDYHKRASSDDKRKTKGQLIKSKDEETIRI